MHTHIIYTLYRILNAVFTNKIKINASNCLGLLDHWFDGCLGLAPTPERLNSFNFTLSHAQNTKSALHFRAGEVPAEKDLHGKKVGK